MNSFKQKITEIPVKATRNETEKSTAGNPVKKKKTVTIYRPVITAETGARFLNYLIDKSIIITLHILLFMGLKKVLKTQVDYDVLIASLKLSFIPIHAILILIYYILFEFFLNRTPGKYVTRTRVINEYCEKPAGRIIIARAFIRLLPAETWSFLFKDRGWHDTWTKTWVVYEREYKEIKQLIEEGKNIDYRNHNFI